MKIVTDVRHFKGLEAILPEGIPQSSIIAIAGTPGAGKTIFSSQLMFELDPSLTAIWFSTFSEPQNLLLSHLSGFDFFDQNKVGNPIQYIDLASVFHEEQKFESVLNLIEEEYQKYEADIVFIDSFRQMLQWAEVSSDSSEAGFRLIQNMPLHFAMRGVTTFLLGEYDEQDIHEQVDFFGMVDGIIRISNQKENFNRNRYIEILKMRGASFISGMHPVRIDDEGFHIYANELRQSEEISTTERISTGVPGADEMLNGGLLKNSFLMLAGASGTGKSIFGLHFLQEGIKNKESVLHYSVEEERSQILRNAASIGLDFLGAEKGDLLFLSSPEHKDASVEEVLSHIQKIVFEKNITRLFLDSATALSRYQPDERFYYFIQSLRIFLKNQGVTLVVASETADVTSASTEKKEVGISSVTDAVISLRYIEVNAKMLRAIMIFKARGSDHDKGFREYFITSKGFSVGQQLSGLEGILRGTTHKIDSSIEEKIHEVLLDAFGPLADTTHEKLKQMSFNLNSIIDYFDDLMQQGILSKKDVDTYLNRIKVILNN